MANGKTCSHCNEIIQIDYHKIDEIVLFKSRYYHQNCFESMCADKMSSKRSRLNWKEILEDINSFKEDAKKTLEFVVTRDALNQHLLDNYNVIKVPDRFWSTIGELEKGSYKKQRCKPVSIKILYETWMWGQKKLDDVAIRNRAANKGPKDDEQRISYDLAIVISKVPNYLSYKAKEKKKENEIRRNVLVEDVDISKIGHQKAHMDDKDDISDIFDDFYS